MKKWTGCPRQPARRPLPVVVLVGTIDAPDVGINLGSMAGRAVKNELQRQTESALKNLLGKKPPKQ